MQMSMYSPLHGIERTIWKPISYYNSHMSHQHPFWFYIPTYIALVSSWKVEEPTPKFHCLEKNLTLIAWFFSIIWCLFIWLWIISNPHKYLSGRFELEMENALWNWDLVYLVSSTSPARSLATCMDFSTHFGLVVESWYRCMS